MKEVKVESVFSAWWSFDMNISTKPWNYKGYVKGRNILSLPSEIS